MDELRNNPGLSAIIITEGWHDVLILDALLRKKGWNSWEKKGDPVKSAEHLEKETEYIHQKRKENGEKILKFKGYTIQILPSKGDRGGKDYIPELISINWQKSQLFFVVFDPDDQEPRSAVQKLYDRIKERVKLIKDEQTAHKESQQIRVVQDELGRQVVLAFWPAMVDKGRWPLSIQDPELAHNMLDYVLVMGMRKDILRKAVDSLSDARRAERVSADQFPKKLKEILRLLQRQGVRLMSSKRVLDFYVALLGFRAGFGHLGSQIIREMPEDDLDSVFGGLPSFIISVLDAINTG
ncbi:hypothetical protein [Thermoflexus sp.]|uniref:hypothetical protein n=1 Tax=Thermoflexus sp. TaxID=1969742 RepID=UPI002ADE01EB|nr:hypothetical protein [Thermoflexus sp.]